MDAAQWRRDYITDVGVTEVVRGEVPCPTDVNGDGVTNVLDLIDLLLAFGAACP